MTAANTNRNEDELLTESQTSVLLKISIRTLQDWRFRGRGPRFIKTGRSVRYRTGDLHDWIEANAARSTAEAGNRS